MIIFLVFTTKLVRLRPARFRRQASGRVCRQGFGHSRRFSASVKPTKSVKPQIKTVLFFFCVCVCVKAKPYSRPAPARFVSRQMRPDRPGRLTRRPLKAKPALAVRGLDDRPPLEAVATNLPKETKSLLIRRLFRFVRPRRLEPPPNMAWEKARPIFPIAFWSR